MQLHIWGSDLPLPQYKKLSTLKCGASSIIIIIQMRFVTRAFAPAGEVNGIMITIDRVTDCDIIEMAMISIISSHNSNNCLS